MGKADILTELILRSNRFSELRIKFDNHLGYNVVQLIGEKEFTSWMDVSRAIGILRRETKISKKKLEEDWKSLVKEYVPSRNVKGIYRVELNGWDFLRFYDTMTLYLMQEDE